MRREYPQRLQTVSHDESLKGKRLVPVEYNRLTVSETVSIDEPAGGYMEILEYRKSARGHLMALEDKSAIEGYLETMMQGTTLKQKAYGTLVSSQMYAEKIERLVSLPWRAVLLRYFEEEMRTTPKIHALIAMPYVRTELRLRFAWCMIGLTRGEYDSKIGNRVEFRLGFSDELLRTSLVVVWELMKPSWCPNPNADSILRATQDVQKN